MKKGDAVIMEFHGYGEISEEKEVIVFSSRKNNTVELSNGYIFSKETGECINDNTHFNCKRTLKLKRG